MKVLDVLENKRDGEMVAMPYSVVLEVTNLLKTYKLREQESANLSNISQNILNKFDDIVENQAKISSQVSQKNNT